MDLRFDTLSQIVYASNVSEESGPVLVMEETNGLILGSLLERMNGQENGIVALHDRSQFSYSIISDMNMPENISGNITLFPWLYLNQDPYQKPSDPSEKDAEDRQAKREKRFKELCDAKALFTQGAFESLVLATNFAVLPIVKHLLPGLAGSASVVIYSPHKEVLRRHFLLTLQSLMETFAFMRSSHEFVNVHLTESWLREYQLPLKKMSGTHPHMTGLPHGGYLLTATRVLFDENQKLNMSFREKKEKKRRKLEERSARE